MPDPTLARLRGRLPQGFERWVVALSPGERRGSAAAEWSGAIIAVEAGVVEVGCVIGASRTFKAGSLIALSCLPLAWLGNPGESETRLVCVRRSAVASSR